MTPELEILRNIEVFQAHMKWVKEQRPEIPPYTRDPDNTETWKSLSDEQRGFELALSLFGEYYE